MKILLVEDEFIVATALKILLEIMGHEVVGIADDVISAVNQSQSTHPQIAFVDMQLANGASGLDAAAELQKSGVLCIFFTGNYILNYARLSWYRIRDRPALRLR